MKRLGVALILAVLGVLAARTSVFERLITVPVAAHGGGLDGYGCHNDRKAGTYHCHRGPCAGRTFSSQAAMLRDACSK